METCFCSLIFFLMNFIQFVMQCCPLTSGWCILLTIVHVCTDEWRPTASTLCPLCWLPRKKVQAVSSSYAQKLKCTILKNFLTIFGLFWTLHISCYSAIGWLKKEREKEEDEKLILTFIQVCHFKIHSDNVPLTRCNEPPVAPFNIVTRSPVHGGSDTVNFTGRRVIDYAHPHLILGITTTVNGTPCNDIERSNGRFVAPRKRDVIAVIVTTSAHCYYYCRLGQAISAILCTFQCLQIKILKIP